MLFAVYALNTQQSGLRGQTRTAASPLELADFPPAARCLRSCGATSGFRTPAYSAKRTRKRKNGSVFFFSFSVTAVVSKMFYNLFYSQYTHTLVICSTSLPGRIFTLGQRGRSGSRTTPHTVPVLHHVPFSVWASEVTPDPIFTPPLCCSALQTRVRDGFGFGAGDMMKHITGKRSLLLV